MISNLLLYILYKVFPIMRERYPSGLKGTPTKISMDAVAMEDSFSHLDENILFGFIINMLSVITPWCLLIYIIPLIYIVYKEGFKDGHIKRIRAGTESKSDLTDFKVDLLVRFSGLVFTSLFIPIIILT